MAQDLVLGLDFGTTNTVLALSDGAGAAEVVRVPYEERELSAFRSVLAFQEPDRVGGPPLVEAGPAAVALFGDDPSATRLIQSFKTFAASKAFRDTDIWGKRWRFEDLLFALLNRLRQQAGDRLGALPRRVVVGRPVVFAGGDPDPALAEGRYREALGRFGFEQLEFVYEPVGAAWYWAQRAQRDALVLVADFGGGTSDFSLVRFERRAGRLVAEPLGSAGVGLAGDAFDYRIIDNVVSPRLGKGGHYASGGKILPMPNRYYAAFARWNQLALLKHSRDMREVRSLAKTALQPEKVGAFVELLEDDHGWRMYQAVSAAKEALSSAEETPFVFEAGAISIRHDIRRADFETWIAPELAAIEGALDLALERAGVPATAVDKVFLTGGSAFVPAVRRLFTDRFGADRIESGGEFESIASGLALMGASQ